MSAAIGHGHPVARKPHACDYCATPIPAGQRYKRWVWLADGAASTVRAHIACDDIADRYYTEGRVYDDERWVEWTPIEEWAANHERVPGSLAAALTTIGKAWPVGEVDRLLAALSRPGAGGRE